MIRPARSMWFAKLIDADPAPLLSAPLLPMIAAQAEQADRSRTLSDEVIQSIKSSPLMRMAASRELGGMGTSITEIARELAFVSAACSSTGWCLWNHQLVFHLFASALGPQHLELLRSIVQNGEWCSYAAGAGTSVIGHVEGDRMVLNGRAAFASGARYGEWSGVPFKLDTDPPYAPLNYTNFTVVRTNAPGVRIEPTWMAMSLRASATDHIVYDQVSVPLSTVTRLQFRFREEFRQPARPAIHPRYREDYIGLSSLWLGALAGGIARAALEETIAEVRDRIAILGVKMSNKPTVQVNLGQAASMISTAWASVMECCHETDRRIDAEIAPTERDYLEQVTRPMQALHQFEEAMRLLLRILGGNGLRETNSFERRFRDIVAMPLHMNVHPDRVSEQLGRHLLGLEPTNFY
jgi:alkylation response protein AidB-like acyl-CoA dehydrogenase